MMKAKGGIDVGVGRDKVGRKVKEIDGEEEKRRSGRETRDKEHDESEKVNR